MFKIQIPKPCHEDWNAMTPTQQGAFCSACNKEVVDFTKMTDEEVQHYFLHRTTDKTCGHFRKEQVDRIRIHLPENILLQKIAGWKKFMAVVMLAFGSMLFGCDVATNQNTVGKTDMVQTQPTDSANIESSQTLGFVLPGPGFELKDSAIQQVNCIGKKEPDVLGTPAQIVKGDTVAIPDTVVPLMGKPVLMGEPAFIDTTTKKPAPDTSKCKDTGYY